MYSGTEDALTIAAHIASTSALVAPSVYAAQVVGQMCAPWLPYLAASRTL